jgi:ribosomal subunit interface protein
MQIPLRITFRNLDRSEAVEAKVRERVDELEQFYDRITGCRVVIEEPNRRQHKGNLFHVRVDLSVPGREIVVKRDPPQHRAHEDIYVAVRDCFDAVRRQLEDHVRRARGDVKTHEAPNHGKILRLVPAEGYGFIASADGTEVYFHRNAVSGNNFDKMREGDQVRFVVHEGEGDKGPQASTVIPIGKHHPEPPRT